MGWVRRKVTRVTAGEKLPPLAVAELQAEDGDAGLCPAEVDASPGHYRCEVEARVPHAEHRRDNVRWRTLVGEEAAEAVRQMLAGIPVMSGAAGEDPAPEAGEAGSVLPEGGWLARQAPEPDGAAVPEDVPEPLPDGVLGYVVVLRGLARDGLADSDLRRTLEEAEADARGHGRRPGWAGRALACEVRAVER
jgi:hypothetical protein